MRIAVFGDIHSNDHALEAVLADMDRRGIDRSICLGDITMKGPLPKECVDRVRSLGCPVVRGNTDSAYHPDLHPRRFPAQNESQVVARKDFDRHLAALPESDQAWLRGLPLTHREDTNGVRLDFFHATPAHNYVLVMPWATTDQLADLQPAPDTGGFAFGHCHRAFIRFVRGVLVVNSGSVGIPFDGDPRPSYALLDVEGGGLTASIVRVPYDPEPAIRAAQDAGMIGWELFAHTARTGFFPG
jgi:predicted phosphodiesterase